MTKIFWLTFAAPIRRDYSYIAASQRCKSSAYISNLPFPHKFSVFWRRQVSSSGRVYVGVDLIDWVRRYIMGRMRSKAIFCAVFVILPFALSSFPISSLHKLSLLNCIIFTVRSISSSFLPFRGRGNLHIFLFCIDAVVLPPIHQLCE